jgi:hypothetical protein
VPGQPYYPQSSPAEVLRQLLIDRGIVEGAVTDLGTYDKTKFWSSVGGFPEGGPDRFVTLVDTGETFIARLQSGERVTFPNVSISIRCVAPYTSGYNKGKQIEGFFDGVGPFDGLGGRNWEEVTIGASAYRVESVTVLSPTMKTGFEEQHRRQVFTLLVRTTLLKL